MQTIRNNLATIIAGIVIALCLAAAFVLLRPQRAASSDTTLSAVVHDGDGGTHRLPLAEDTTLEVTTSLGRNVIVVEGGSARVTEADCPNGSCTQQQSISKPGQQLICLPHKLWVEVTMQEGDESKLDPNAVSYSEDVDLVAR